MANYDKWSCLERARNLLSVAGDDSLRYACLELRFCIEAITYEKLDTYSSYVPATERLGSGLELSVFNI
jgi:hypothetical protein